jgi:hypothetical protein
MRRRMKNQVGGGRSLYVLVVYIQKSALLGGEVCSIIRKCACKLAHTRGFAPAEVKEKHKKKYFYDLSAPNVCELIVVFVCESCGKREKDLCNFALLSF